MFKKLKTIFFYLLLIYGVVGFLILPYVLKSSIIDIVSKETNATVEIESVYINPFLLKISLKNLRLKNLKDEELVSFKELYLDVEFYSVFRKAIHVKEFLLLEPKVSLVYEADKTLNLLKILKDSEVQEQKEEEESGFALPRIILEKIKLQTGTFKYKDLTLKTPFKTELKNIGFTLKNIDTSEQESSNASLRLYALLEDGGFVDLKTKLNTLHDLEAIGVKGTLNIDATPIYTKWKYVQDILQLEVADGKISLNAAFEFSLADLNATKIDNLNLSVEKLRIKPKTKNEDILKIESFHVRDSTIYPFLQKVEIENVSLDGLRLYAKRNRAGEIETLKYLEINEEKKQDTNKTAKTAKTVKKVETKEETKAWDVRLVNTAFSDIAVAFEDFTIYPAVKTKIHKLNLKAENFTLLGEEAFTYEMDMWLNKEGKCSSKGSVAHKNLKIKNSLECKKLDITHYNPYIISEANKELLEYNLDLKHALLSFGINAEIKEYKKSKTSENELEIILKDASLGIDDLVLNKKGDTSKVLSFSAFSIKDIDLNTRSKDINIKKVMLNNLSINVQKDKNSLLNLENLVVTNADVDAQIDVKKSVSSVKSTNPTPLNASTRKIKEEKPYSLKLKHFALNSSDVVFRDESLAQTATNKIKNIYLNAYDIDISDETWLTYTLALNVNSQGSVKSEGKLRHTPLKHSGKFTIKDVSLKSITPYLQESLFVSVEDGRLSLMGNAEYEKSQNSPDLRVKGSLLLESFFMNETLTQTPIVSLGSLDVKTYTFELEPSRLHVDEVDVNSFYVDAHIDSKKILNFAKLIKKTEETTKEQTSKKEEIKEEKQEKNDAPAFPFKILKVNVASGSAKFADDSIPIKFATNIHGLSGSIYSISNNKGDTAFINIAGDIDKYGSTKLRGSVDITDPKAYTDLKFQFSNLELNSFSGYSASFAGHEIASGKFDIDLGYKILNSNLQGSNSVVINKIKLGSVIKDKNITVLPLGFVIGLLEDSDGVIDINMPVEGNLDSPDFKYGTLVLKTFTNLIVSAVSSPFKFLGAMMGINTDALEFVAFESGSSTIAPPQREKLDQIAELMQKKPKISLGVPSIYDEKVDKQALQHKKLIELVAEKSGQRNKEENENAVNASMLEGIYESMGGRSEILEKTKEKLRTEHKDERAYERSYLKELIILSRNLQEVTQAELQELSQKRAQNIVNYLLDEKMVDSLRVSKKGSKISKGNKATTVKVNLEIEVK